MNFKDFLYLEDPDNVSGLYSYASEDALTVTIFKNYYLYGLTKDITHEQMMFYAYLSRLSAMDLGEIGGEKQKFMLQVLSHRDELFPSGVVRVVGRFHPSIKRGLIKEFNGAIMYGYHDLELLKNRIVHEKMVIGRESLLTAFRNVLFARVWKNSKVISFWNVYSSISPLKSDVYSFLKSLGYAVGDFRYEVSNHLLSYADFDVGNLQGSELDVGKLHTLGPEKKNIALRGMGVVPRKPVDIGARLLTRAE